MTERENARLIAWSIELLRAHARIRDVLRIARRAFRDGSRDDSAGRDLLLHCQSFCSALDRHHRGEDRTLFPAIEADHPELAPTLRDLSQDHMMIADLLTDLATTMNMPATAESLERHIEGIAAIMENHFRHEEKQLLEVLEHLELSATVSDALGTVG